MIKCDDKAFCREGCKQVYLLNENNLCSYYNLDKNPGIKVKAKFTSNRFAYLDDVATADKLVQFSSPYQTNVTFSLPQMHCSSCVFLLENLHRIGHGWQLPLYSMCGPLAFSLPMDNRGDFAKFAGTLLYNLGRIITYGTLGLLFGLLGKSFSLFGFQQGLSILVGSVILIVLLIPKNISAMWAVATFFNRYINDVRAALGNLFFKKNYSSLLAIGLLNGLLPCGLIYMAMAGAIASAHPLKSAFFMASFGLGTLPVMWSVSFFGNYIGLKLRQKIRSAYPVMMAMMACLLIVRGLGLGIPYVSPSMNKNTAEVQICHPVENDMSKHEMSK